ncbi:MAG TPA: ATP-binding protein [Vicinamibacterales bacterium]|nr:ATP-binding protein [Vicinamibacterales bacterium]
MAKRTPQEIAVELDRLRQQSTGNRSRLSLLHDLQVFQEELVAQNEELLHAQAALEETRDRYIELYDFSPNGYLTLDSHGVVVRINLTGAAVLGGSRQAIEGMPLLGFVARESRPAFLDFVRRCRRCADGAAIETEIRLRPADGEKTVQLLCRPRLSSASGEREYFTTMIDVTERRRLERERDRSAREHAALATRLLSVQDDERQRIARDLHDDIGQEVTALRLKVELIEGSGGSGRDVLREIRANLEKLDSRIHLIATELRPASLDLGIVAAMRQFVQRWSSALGIPAAFHAAGLDRMRLRPQVETHVYRVAQEALNNIHKHADATRASVLLERRNGGVVLIIEDDGRGFDADEARSKTTALGLVGMRERAQIIGGRLEIETAPGRGTSVYLHLPDAL